MEPKLSKITIICMVTVAVLFDLAQLGVDALHLLIGPGTIIASVLTAIIAIIAWLTFYIWFKTKGINFVSPKRILTFGGGFLIELLPALNALPAWTLAVVILIGTNKAEQIIAEQTGLEVNLNNPQKGVRVAEKAENPIEETTDRAKIME